MIDRAAGRDILGKAGAQIIWEFGIVGWPCLDVVTSDDPEFPNYLRARLSEYVAAGGTVDHVILWDYNANDGKWRFTGVPGKEATAAAWTSFVTTSKPL
ncbi:MAG: hypothetical protein EOO77_41220 [Oxalobacteraceae bacterium]|nr:MAG: hypothetical protein EOO77_41220 [Oxalobacteraceae bacterium]